MEDITHHMREETREVMEYLGRAMHTASIFEYSLILLLTLNATKKERNIAGERWTALFEAGRERTLGGLVKRTMAEVNASDEDLSVLNHGLGRRNYLVHGYMLENDQRLYDPKERLVMVKELDSIREEIRAGDKVAVKYIDVLLKRYGLSTEMLKEMAADFYRSKNLPDVPVQ